MATKKKAAKKTIPKTKNAAEKKGRRRKKKRPEKAVSSATGARIHEIVDGEEFGCTYGSPAAVVHADAAEPE